MSAAFQLLITLLTILPKLISAAIECVQAIETGFQTVADATGNSAAKTGATKLTVLQGGLQALYDAEGTLASSIPVSTLQAIFGKIASIAVSAFTALGWFKHSQPVVVAP